MAKLVTKLATRVVLFILGFASVATFCKQQTDGFTITSITSTLAYHSEWDCPSPTPDTDLHAILDQPFAYLGKGSQAFAFASEDGKYVLKLFRHDHMRPRIWSFFIQRPGDLRRQAKLYESFSSYKIAGEAFSEESGLVFLHLNKTKNLQQKLQIVDKIGIRHELNADNMEFLVQKKASLLYPTIEQWIASGKMEQCKTLLSSLVTLIKSRQAKGIGDKDPNLETNFGVLDDKVVQIDIGRFRKDKKKDPSELIRITDSLHHFLRERYPELDAYLMEILHEA